MPLTHNLYTLVLREHSLFYKITELLRALSLVDSYVLMRVCKHGCDILDTRVLFKIIL